MPGESCAEICAEICACGSNTPNSVPLALPSRRGPRVDQLHLVALAVVQGVAEFLLISSDAHLALLGSLFPSRQAGAAVLIPLHLGSVLAVVVYFRSDLWSASIT